MRLMPSAIASIRLGEYEPPAWFERIWKGGESLKRSLSTVTRRAPCPKVPPSAQTIQPADLTQSHRISLGQARCPLPAPPVLPTPTPSSQRQDTGPVGARGKGRGGLHAWRAALLFHAMQATIRAPCC